MQVTFSHMGLVYNFVDDQFDSKEIYNNLLPSVITLLEKENVKIPIEWRLIFQVGYTNGKSPLVSKNKLGRYPSDKFKYITIIVPIPLLSEIEWGVNPEQHIYGKDHYDKLMNNFFELDINYRKYENRADYIIACLKAGIRKAFNEGFTIGGVKIKSKHLIEL